MLVKENLLENTTSVIKGVHKYAYMGFNVTKFKGQIISFSLHRKVIKGETPIFTTNIYNTVKSKTEQFFSQKQSDIAIVQGAKIPNTDEDILLLTYNGIPGNTLGVDVEYSKPYLCIGDTLPDIYIPAKADLIKSSLYPNDGEYTEIKAIWKEKKWQRE